jgi:hypothetical protein
VGRLSLDDAGWREALAETIEAGKIDVVIAGPVTRLGMNEAGTLQEVRDFMALVNEVRTRSGRRVAIVLIHHENKGGKVSGAWEGSGDTLVHVTGKGPGGTRLYFQKARWSSRYHATTLHLRWVEGEGFELAVPGAVPEDANLAFCRSGLNPTRGASKEPANGLSPSEGPVHGRGKGPICRQTARPERVARLL